MHRLDQRVRFVVAGEDEVGDGGTGDTVLGDDDQLMGRGIGEDDDGVFDGGLRDQPVHRASGGNLQIGAGQEKLRQPELRFQLAGRDLDDRRHGPMHWLFILRRQPVGGGPTALF